MSTIVVVVVVVVIGALLGALLVSFLRRRKAPSRGLKAPSRGLVSVRKIPNDTDYEICYKRGDKTYVYRGSGTVWCHYPSGDRASGSLEDWLTARWSAQRMQEQDARAHAAKSSDEPEV